MKFIKVTTAASEKTLYICTRNIISVAEHPEEPRRAVISLDDNCEIIVLEEVGDIMDQINGVPSPAYTGPTQFD